MPKLATAVPGSGQAELPLLGSDFEENSSLARPQSARAATKNEATPVHSLLADYVWPEVLQQVDRQGWAHLPRLLTAAQCTQLAALYDEPQHFRSRIVMQRHAFGQGEYQYLAYPLPPLVQTLRSALYAQLQPLAAHWRDVLQTGGAPWPATHAGLLAQCQAVGQQRPTPLLLRYGAGDYNCLHQDVYGDLVFPLQVVVLLSQPGRDFDGGELVLTEQRPRMQSRVQVLQLQQGDASIIAVRERPVQGTRGSYRVQHRHGVSTITRGARHTLGVVLHDAQ